MSQRSFSIRNPFRFEGLSEPARRFLKNKGTVSGLVFVMLLLVASLAALLFLDFDSDVISVTSGVLRPPSIAHLFGTDHLGRDVFKRVVYGSVYSISIGVGSTVLGILIGVVFGSIAGYYRGIAGEAVMRIKSLPFIESARCIGQGSVKIIARHIIPSCASYVVVQMMMSIGSAMLLVSGRHEGSDFRYENS